RVELQRAIELVQRLVDGLPNPPVEVSHSPQVVVVRVEAFRRLPLRTFDLRSLELRRDRADDGLRHLILQLEDVAEGAIEAIGPDVAAGGRIDELSGNAHALRLAHAPFQHVAHTEVASDLSDVR